MIRPNGPRHDFASHTFAALVVAAFVENADASEDDCVHARNLAAVASEVGETAERAARKEVGRVDAELPVAAGGDDPCGQAFVRLADYEFLFVDYAFSFVRSESISGFA